MCEVSVVWLREYLSRNTAHTTKHTDNNEAHQNQVKKQLDIKVYFS